MRGFFSGLILCALVTACAGGAVPGLGMLVPASGSAVSATSPNIAAAVADPRRTEADRARDALRHPADILAFAGVRSGMRVVDVGPGPAGYYSRMFAVAVGDRGHVYGVSRPPNPQATQPPAFRAVAAQYTNVTPLEAGYVGWNAGAPLDIVFVSQIYHDFTLSAVNVDPAQFNREVFAALKPGGTYIVIDHAGPAGMTMDPNGQTALHRIDQALVRRQVEAAGFVFDGETDVLRNPADNRSERVFESDIRGHTDQFAMRFKKPG